MAMNNLTDWSLNGIITAKDLNAMPNSWWRNGEPTYFSSSTSAHPDTVKRTYTTTGAPVGGGATNAIDYGQFETVSLPELIPTPTMLISGDFVDQMHKAQKAIEALGLAMGRSVGGVTEDEFAALLYGKPAQPRTPVVEPVRRLRAIDLSDL